MKTIWKYTLLPHTHIDMPVGAQILSIHEQDAEVCMWVMVEPEAATERRTFAYFGTGHRLPANPMEFLGTAHVLLISGSLVFHVFEVLRG
jgi:hypothetical protein